MTQAHAQEIATSALLWLLTNEDLLPVFLGSTGTEASKLRAQTDDPEFLAAVLDFLLMDDAWVLAFCTDQNLPGGALITARAMLPGGENVHWT